jgi:glycosyltransferase involved in cell wall biosynthesis
MQSKVAWAFVGSVVPDEAKYQNEAFSRAGNMFQTELLSNIGRAGLPASKVIAVIPVLQWPKSRTLFVKGDKCQLKDGTRVELPGFVNIAFLKQCFIGLGVFRRLLGWGWRTRRCCTRVVSTFNLSVPPGIFTLAATRLIGAKAVAHLYDINVPGETVPRSIMFRMDYGLQRWLMPRFDALVVVSDAIIRDFGLRAPHVRVEGGVAEAVFASVSQRTDPARFVIVSAGSLNVANGLKVLLAGFSSLIGDHYRLRIAGAGPLEADVRRAAALDSRIEYCGYLSFADVLRLYEAADVLVNLRLTKSVNTKYFFPSKLLECLASGRPVVSTCTGHVEEEFGEFTFLLREETPNGFAAAVQHVERLGKDAREQKGAMARDYMMANKTWSKQGGRVVRLIESLVAEGSGEAI